MLPWPGLPQRPRHPWRPEAPRGARDVHPWICRFHCVGARGAWPCLVSPEDPSSARGARHPYHLHCAAALCTMSCIGPGGGQASPGRSPRRQDAPPAGTCTPWLCCQTPRGAPHGYIRLPCELTQVDEPDEPGEPRWGENRTCSSIPFEGDKMHSRVQSRILSALIHGCCRDKCFLVQHSSFLTTKPKPGSRPHM